MNHLKEVDDRLNAISVRESRQITRRLVTTADGLFGSWLTVCAVSYTVALIMSLIQESDSVGAVFSNPILWTGVGHMAAILAFTAATYALIGSTMHRIASALEKIANKYGE